MRTPDAPRTRLWALDGLRGLAALAVVLYHYLYRARELYPEQLGAPSDWIQWGSYGVQLFFLISGYVIFDSARTSDQSRFLFNRAVRIYPAYWMCALITLVVVGLCGLAGRDSLTPLEQAINFTLLQGFVGVPYIDGAWWTLTVELAFYAQIAILARWGLLTGGRLIPTLFAWIFFLVSARFVIVALDIDSVSHLSGVFYWGLTFVIGIAANLALSGRRVAGIAVGSAALIGLLPGNLSILVPMLVAISLLMLTVLVRLPSRWEKVGSYLGELSYPLYLLHQNIGYVLLLALAAAGVSRSLAVVATVVIVVSLATLIAYGADVPLRRRLRAAYGRTRLRHTLNGRAEAID